MSSPWIVASTRADCGALRSLCPVDYGLPGLTVYAIPGYRWYVSG